MSRLVLVLVAGTLVVSACGSATRTEVPTNSGGILDCPSETIEYATFDQSFTTPGAEQPVDALADLTTDVGLPPGSPAVESEAAGEVVFVFTDGAGNRVGRALVVQPDTGWYIQWTERCG